MPPKKETCRNFARGSCQFGDRCRYLHAAQMNSSSSPFGGTPSQKSNPFGFGVQSGNQSQQTNFGQQPRGGFSDFATKPNQTKPFQNTWVRDQPNSGGQPNHQASQTKTQPPQHKCTDAESCKRVIVDDFQNERPVWKLSCYSHLRDGPCDIAGDVSSEELRAAAYDDARHGLALQAIIEKERNLLSSKLMEYDALAKNYNKVPVNSAFGVQSPFHNNTQNTPTIAGSNNPPTLSSFSQFSATINTGPAAPPSSMFGQLNPLQNGSQPSSTFTSQPPGTFASQPSSAFTASGPFTSQTPGPFTSQTPGPFTSQTPSSFTSQIPGTFTSQMPSPFTSQTPGPFSSQTPGPFTSQTLGPFGNTSTTSQQNRGFPSTQASVRLTMENTGLNLNMPPENVDVDDSIWMQATWEIGKIPESVPPARHC